MNLENAQILITGSSSGIGLETAKHLKTKGAQVFLTARQPEKLEAAAAELKAPYFAADISQESEVRALFEKVHHTFDHLNVLINNAGFGKFSLLTETSKEEFQSQWEVNTLGSFLAAREAAQHFINQNYGNIINIGSTAALRGFQSGSSYCSSKFAVSGLTECWRAELRPYNIRVMQVNPSEVVTEFISKAGMVNSNTEYKLKPKDIAHAIASMLSMDDIGFIPSAEVWATNPNRK